MKLQESSPPSSISIWWYICSYYIDTCYFPVLPSHCGFTALALDLGKTFGGVIGSHLSHLTSETRKPSGVTRLNRNVEKIRTPSSIRRKWRPLGTFTFGVVGSWKCEASGDESRVVVWRRSDHEDILDGSINKIPGTPNDPRFWLELGNDLEGEIIPPKPICMTLGPWYTPEN